jgi:hypothetical protein
MPQAHSKVPEKEVLYHLQIDTCYFQIVMGAYVAILIYALQVESTFVFSFVWIVILMLKTAMHYKQKFEKYGKQLGIKKKR